MRRTTAFVWRSFTLYTLIMMSWGLQWHVYNVMILVGTLSFCSDSLLNLSHKKDWLKYNPRICHETMKSDDYYGRRNTPWGQKTALWWRSCILYTNNDFLCLIIMSSCTKSLLNLHYKNYWSICSPWVWRRDNEKWWLLW